MLPCALLWRAAGLTETALPHCLPSRLRRCLLLLWEEARSLVHPLADPGLLEWIEAEHNALAGKQEAADSPSWEAAAVQHAQALASLPRCAHLACTSLAGSSEAQLHLLGCSACRVARYCSAASWLTGGPGTSASAPCWQLQDSPWQQRAQRARMRQQPDVKSRLAERIPGACN